MVRTASLLLPQTGRRMSLFVPRVLHPVRLRNLRARGGAAWEQRNPGNWYWWDRLNYKVIPYQRRANDEWPLAFKVVDPVGSGGFDALELDGIVEGAGLTGQLRYHPWPGFVIGGIRIIEEGPWSMTTGAYQLSGDACPVERSAPSRPSSSSTAPTVPVPVVRCVAAGKSASSIRSSKMTSALKASTLAQKKYVNVPPHGSDDVATVMRERGIGRKGAYDYIRQQKLAKFDAVEVPHSQRTLVLGSLIDHGGTAKNGMVLLDQLHSDGVNIDMHDTIKTLWALQKTRFVTFRERRNPPNLYAIKVTKQGFDAYSDMKERLYDNARVTQDILVAADIRQRQTDAEVAAEAEAELIRQLQADAEAEATTPAEKFGVEVETIYPDTPEWEESERALEKQRAAENGALVVDLTDLPLMRAIRDRARKETVLAQAAKLLEEAGEDDIAVLVMEQTKYDALELEVKKLLRNIGEV